jgi:signal transduction histidine kinase
MPIANMGLVLVAVADAELSSEVCEALADNYQLRVATEHEAVLELARILQPEVVIGDVDGPCHGFQLCQQLRSADHTKPLPFLLLTRDGEQARGGFEAGVSDCVLIPFTPNELLARVELHVRLRRLTSQLARKERLAALGSLAATIAHNVRNPLSALISGLPTMRKRLAPHLDPSTSELMDVMLDCASRIERMTLDLLDLSRVDRDTTSDFAPGSGLLACTRMFASRLDGKTVDLETDVDILAMTSGRAGDVNHVFMNVIDNALRAIDGKGQIRVRGAVDDGHYVVTIGDSGRGIDEAQLACVFEPFWTTRAAGEGTGLGLAIARQIVEEHGGTIAAGRSSLGGAEFTIRLPLRRAERAA